MTNLALDIVKGSLKRKKNEDGLKRLDELIQQLTDSMEAKDPTQRIMDEQMSPRRLIEELYYIGLTEVSPDSADSGKANYLKIAQDLLNTRY